MRFVWMVFIGLVAAMLVVVPRMSRKAATPAAPVVRTGLRTNEPAANLGRADSVVAFGLAQRGTPYVYAGVSPITGFDCSGFILYTFAHVGVAVPHSTALLIDVGQPVARADAQPGDIVVFTGTATTSTTPGHAGIVISGRGEVPLRFVHASSSRREPFVKVNQVEGSDYERRFMQVRRVLGPGVAGRALAMRAAPMAAVSRAATAVAALPVPKVPVNTATVAAAPPAVLATRKRPATPVVSRKAAAPAARKKAPATRTATAKKKAAVAARPKPVRKPTRTTKPKPGTGR